MSCYYDTCRRNVGRAVRIRTHDGRIHCGVIHRVDRRAVYLTPYGAPIKGEATKAQHLAEYAVADGEKGKGEEVLFFSPFIVPLAAIAGLTFIGAASLFWW